LNEIAPSIAFTAHAQCKPNPAPRLRIACSGIGGRGVPTVMPPPPMPEQAMRSRGAGFGLH